MRAIDGPAADLKLSLRRCPIFLRLVQDTSTLTWDALDQPDDTPGPSESVHVYRRVEGTWAQVHMCYRGRQRALSGWYQFADYRHVEGVDGEAVRDTGPWREWCLAQPPPAPVSVTST